MTEFKKPTNPSDIFFGLSGLCGLAIIARLVIGGILWLQNAYWTPYTVCDTFALFWFNSTRLQGLNKLLDSVAMSDIGYVFLALAILFWVIGAANE